MPYDNNVCKQEFIELTLLYLPKLKAAIVPATSPNPYRPQLLDIERKSLRERTQPVYRPSHAAHCSLKKNDVTFANVMREDQQNVIKKLKSESQPSSAPNAD